MVESRDSPGGSMADLRAEVDLFGEKATRGEIGPMTPSQY
jgi:hypothetical protein